MRMGLLLIGCALFATSTHAAAALRDGDIIFHTSRSAQSAAIQRATHSPYSHVGIVIHRDGKPYVFEANATVRYTPLADWIARGDGGRYVVKRLAGGLTAEQAAQLRATARLQELREFDLSDPVVKSKMRERYGSRVPLDEPVISPGAQFASPLLTTVANQ